MKASRPASIRQIFFVAAVCLVSLVLVLGAAMAVFAASQHRETERIRQTTEALIQAQEARFGVRMIARSMDPALLAQADRHLGIVFERLAGQELPDDAALLARAKAATAAFRAALTDPTVPDDLVETTRARTRDALNALVTRNEAQLRAAQAEAVHQARVATVLAGVAAVAALVLVGLVLGRVRRELVAPIEELKRMVDAFDPRRPIPPAPEAGARELRELGVHLHDNGVEIAALHRAQVTFLGAVAHDLRNPLTAIEMSLGAIPENTPVPPRVRRALDVVQRQVDRLARMAADFLDATRLEAGSFELHRELRDLRGVVSEACERFQDMSPGHLVHVAAGEDPLPVKVDPMRLEQVLSNLLCNATKYCPSGGEVRVASFRRGDEAGVAVEHAGLGLSALDLERTWEPFRRSGSSAESTPGAGLGLSLVRKIVEAQDGHLDIAPRPGGGTIFTVVVPLVPVLAAPPPRVSRPSTARAAGAPTAPPPSTA